MFKQPATDSRKKSKAGRLKLIKEHSPWAGNVKVWDEFRTVGVGEDGDDVMVEVFRDGAVLVNPTLDDIRNRAEIN